MAAANGITKEDIEQKAQSYSSPNAKPTNWDTPGPSAFDFRSDTITTPTASMLSSIAATTLLDDVFCEDPTTNTFESSIASLTNFPAALLVLSGTMGNQISLRTHLGAPPHAILTDYRSHILEWEAGGAASLCGALVKGVRPVNGHHLTLEDVKREAVVSDDVHACPTRLISLENTLAGTIMPLSDCQSIAAWARSQDPPIAVHMDGARLWEAVASGAGSIQDYCACFDSISLCFSKGLGAPVGSVICGSAAFIKRARWVRKSIGGGLRMTGVLTAPMRVALEETYQGGKLAESHVKAKRIAGMWEEMGGRLAEPTETNMVWLDLGKAGTTKDKFIALGLEHGLRLLGGRLVVHYQIGEEAIGKLEGLMRVVLKKGGDVEVDGKKDVVDKMKLNVE